MRLTEEHEAIRNTIAQFIDKEINPYCDQWEEDGIFPAHELFKKMGDLGLLGIAKPVEYGGMGLDYSYQIVFSEELGRIASGGISMAIGVQTDMATPAMAKFGSDHIKQEFLRKAISGEAVCSIAVSEPHAGSDVAAIKTTAVKDGEDYVINGTKMWITNATQADYLCLLANTGGDHKHLNKSLVVVPTNTPGISFSEKLNKLGMRSSDTAQIFFDDVRVPQINRIGDEDLTLYVYGSVKKTDTHMRVLGPGFSLLGNPFPVDIQLGESGIYSADNGYVSTSSPSTSDLLFVIAADGTFDSYFYLTSPRGGSGWRKVGDSSTDVSTQILPAASSFYIQHRGTGLTWNPSRPYNL